MKNLFTVKSFTFVSDVREGENSYLRQGVCSTPGVFLFVCLLGEILKMLTNFDEMFWRGAVCH